MAEVNDLIVRLKRAGCLSDLGLISEVSQSLDVKMDLIDSDLNATLEHYFHGEVEGKLLFYAFKKAESSLRPARYDRILNDYVQ